MILVWPSFYLSVYLFVFSAGSVLSSTFCSFFSLCFVLLLLFNFSNSFLVYLLYFNASGYACSTYFISQLLYVCSISPTFPFFSSRHPGYRFLSPIHFLMKWNASCCYLFLFLQQLLLLLLFVKFFFSVLIELKTTILLKDSGKICLKNIFFTTINEL